MIQKKFLLADAYNPERFREDAHLLIDRLAELLEKSLNRKLDCVLPAKSPDEMMREWDEDFPTRPGRSFKALVDKTLRLSHNLQHPRYIGHQCCAPLPLAALNDLLGNLINNGSAVYEMGPANVIMEKKIIDWMGGLAGYSKKADGIMTNGGTAGNLTALLAARQAMSDYDIWKSGYDSSRALALLVSDACHYSVKRAAAVMGIGEDAVYLVPVDNYYKIDHRALEKTYHQAVSDGRKPFVLVGNGCSTATGTYDDLEFLADFAKLHHMWFHVDGAHGSSALLSPKYRHLLNGIDRADSFVWDAHKMLMIPALATAVLFKDGSHSYESFSQKASYLFEGEPRDEWFNYAHRTLECTKTMMGIKLYVPLMVYGTDLFREYVEYTYDLTKKFAGMISSSKDFDLALEPESNIICFRYIASDAKDLDELQRQIRRQVLKRERFYIVQTALKEGFWLRCTVINPNTTIDDCAELLDEIRKAASLI